MHQCLEVRPVEVRSLNPRPGDPNDVGNWEKTKIGDPHQMGPRRAKMGQDGPSLEMVLEVVLLAALHRCASEFEVFSQVAVVTILHGVLDLLTWHTQHAAPCHLALLGRLSARLLAISIESNVLPCLLRTGEWCAKPQGAQDPPSAHVASRCQAEMENYFRDWSEELWSRTSTWA